MRPPWIWARREGQVELRFVGKPDSSDRPGILAASDDGPAPDVAWLRQVHSSRVIAARAGACGEGDALLTGRPGLALCVAAADCVPILLFSQDRIAAIHAGWRGLAGKVIAAAVDRLGCRPEDSSAWIGPAIGPCCYEVGSEVADAVATASDPNVIRRLPAGRPYLDLFAAAGHQLRDCGVASVQTLPLCTACEAEKLWSYRRDGARAGRNFGFIWLRSGD